MARFKNPLWIVLLLPTLSIAHSEHHHVQPAVDAERWPLYLQNFRSEGKAEDLEAAKAIAAHFGSHMVTIEHRYLAAQTAQADHRFGEALLILQTLIRENPHLDNIRLMLINTLVTMGAADDAARHCGELHDLPVSMILSCQLLTKGDRRTYQQLTAVIEVEKDVMPEPQLAWVYGTLGDHAAAAEDPLAAERLYRHAIAAEPLVSYQISLVETLLRQARYAEALALANRYPDHLAMQVKQSIALRALQRPSLFLEQNLLTGFAQDISVGDYSHGREMAEFFIFVRDNAPRAREILTASMQWQHTVQDERLWRLANR